MTPPLALATTTALALVAFAANSLLCRIALADGSTDPATFTAIRLGAGALVLAALVSVRGQQPWWRPRWRGGFALFAYAAGFSWAYVAIGAATGALLLFGAVQITMVATGLAHGERLKGRQWVGFATAAAGVAALLLPGAAMPSLLPALCMMGAGVAWGLYSLWGRGAADPIAATAGNFLYSLPFAAGLLALQGNALALDTRGLLCAVASGAITSGLGYVLWYRVLPALGALRAASLQLTVPPLALLGGVLLLGETLDTARLAGGTLVLLGIGAVLNRPVLR